MAAGGSAANLHLGPGRLWVAPLGTAEPTSASGALNASFVAVGYTEDGSAVQFTRNTDNVMVAEELDPVKVVTTDRETKVVFTMAEITRRNLLLALNSGILANNSAVAYPPAPGNEQRVMLVWDSEETATANPANKRWVFLDCSNTATVEIPRRRGSDKSLLAVEFTAVVTTSTIVPSVNVPFYAFPNSSGLV